MKKIELSSIPQKEILAGFKAQFVHTDNMTLSFVEVEVGAVLPEHSHIHEQVTQLLEGKFELVLEGETHLLLPGSILIIPSNAKHSGRAIEKSKLMDVFNPVREDYLEI